MEKAKGKIPAVIDTNIIVSALIKECGYSRAFLAFFSEIFRFYAPGIVVKEVMRHADEIARKRKKDDEIYDALNKVVKESDIVLVGEERYGPLLRTALSYVNDRYDAPFVAVAMALPGKKKFIITRNVDDYKAEKLERKQIVVRTPEDIVREWGLEYVSKEHRFRIKGKGFRLAGRKRQVFIKKQKRL